MVRKFVMILGIVAGLSFMAGSGCATEEKSAARSGSVATTPQEKARREQLAEMQKQDAADASTTAPKTQPKKRTPPRQRRSEQRVVDQPMRP